VSRPGRFIRGNVPFYTMNRRMGGPQNIFEKRKNLDNKFMKKKKKKRKEKKKKKKKKKKTTTTTTTVMCSKPVTFIFVILNCLVLYGLYLRLI
jgi:predicted RND superfamily exporter protein